MNLASVRLERADASRLATGLLGAAGTPDPAARTVTEHLVDGSVIGVETHGLALLPSYLGAIERGEVDPRAVPSPAYGDGSMRRIDARRAFGQVAGVLALAEARRVAEESGLGVVSVANGGHFGRLGAYVEPLAELGFVALAFSSNPARFQGVAWHGSPLGRLGSNPIAYAVPTSAAPLVADMATSGLSAGAVRAAGAAGRRLPEGVLLDASGRPTTDPDALFAAERGALLPLGGPVLGYKGSVLGLLVEVMATLLSGGRTTDPDREHDLTLCAMRPPSGFESAADDLVAHLRAAGTASGEIHLPGEDFPARRNAGSTLDVDAGLWATLTTLADRHGVPPPVPVTYESGDPHHPHRAG